MFYLMLHLLFAIIINVIWSIFANEIMIIIFFLLLAKVYEIMKSYI